MNTDNVKEMMVKAENALNNDADTMDARVMLAEALTELLEEVESVDFDSEGVYVWDDLEWDEPTPKRTVSDYRNGRYAEVESALWDEDSKQVALLSNDGICFGLDNLDLYDMTGVANAILEAVA